MFMYIVLSVLLWYGLSALQKRVLRYSDRKENKSMERLYYFLTALIINII